MYQVLLVDDEPILQLGIRRMLEGAADYQICASARNGEEALQYLQAHPVDIVMTDLKMPVMDGITLIKELKRRQLPAPVIVLSNYSDFELVREALTEGASEYVLKLDLTAQTLLKQLDKLAASLNAVRRTRGEQLPPQEQGELLQVFIQEQFVSDGMCADAAIHDTDGHNPHAHILLTVRPLDERGKWQYKTEKEYLCMKNGEERGFTAAEFKVAQTDGWEKQYQYKVCKKKVYMAPSAAEAQGLVRADKYPKSTRYGRQNPISERWNSEEQLLTWRAAWADMSNRHLERAGREERIDHRSNAARGIDEIPTIHEGVTAQALERKGIISDRCEINRQIKADNALLRELKAEIKKLAALVARTVPAIAEGLEKLRSRVLIFCYQLSHIRSGKSHIQKSLAVWKPEMERYAGLVQQIKEKSKERKSLVAEKKELPIYHVKRHKALAVRIAELTEDLEELRSEKALLLQKFEYAEDAGAEAFRKDIATMEAGLKKLETREQKYSVELDNVLTEYAELKAQAVELDPVELYETRQAIRPVQEKESEKQLEDAMHEKPFLIMLLGAKQETSRLLGEDAEERQVRQLIAHKRQEQHRNSISKRKRSDPER